MKNLLNREPAMVMGALQALIALVVAFGLDLSAGQIAAVMGAAAAALSLVVRKKVSPVSNG